MDNPDDLAKPLNLCDECKKNPSKYKCPGCSLRSCSLPCVNAHKRRTACTGKKSLTTVVPISQFDDNLLISDYNMLENVKRVADSAQRMRVKLCGYSHFKLPYHLQSLRSAASSRRINLLILSHGMSKRRTNRTYYNHRKKFISWTIEWRFHSTDVVLLDHGVHENSALSSVIGKHLKPGPWNHPLRRFCDETLDSLKFFIRKYPKGPKSTFSQLNIKAPIREQLANITILEYPIIHVFLPSHRCDFDVINASLPIKAEIEEPENLAQPASPKGVIFKEEEIEDHESSDPHVSDLMNHTQENNESDNVLEKVVEATLPHVEGANNTGSVPASANDAGSNSNSCIEPVVAEIADLDFDFEPNLANLYADLMVGSNPGDFLDFDEMLGDNQKNLDFGGFFMDEEELEEGEIR